MVGLTLFLVWHSVAATPEKSVHQERLWALAIFTRVDQLPSIQSAKHALNAAAFSQDAASKPLHNPELGMEIDNKTDKTIGLSISQTLDWSGMGKARQNTAEAERRVAESNYAEKLNQTYVTVLHALNQQHATKQLASLAETQIELLQRLIDVTDKRLAAGDLSLLDNELAKLSLSEALYDIAQAESELANANGAVFSELGVIDPPAFPSLTWSSLPTQHAGEDAIDTLPSILAAQAQLQSARGLVQQAATQQRADPTLGLGAGKEGDENVIGFSFSIPLLVRNPFSSELNAARANELAVEQQVAESRRRALANRETKANQYQRLYDQWQRWQQLTTKRFKESKTLLTTLWESGDITTADYVFGLQQRMQALKAGIAFERDLFGAWVEWLDANGQVEPWLRQLAANPPNP